MYHLTLATGDCRWSSRSEVRDEAIAGIQPVVRAGVGPLGDTGWFIRMIAAETPGGAAFECHHGAPRELGGRWMASCYVAWRETAATKMWAAAMQHRPLVKPGLKRPPLPWLAAAIMPEALFMLDPELMFQLGDLERCIGWAILDSVTQESV